MHHARHTLTTTPKRGGVMVSLKFCKMGIIEVFILISGELDNIFGKLVIKGIGGGLLLY